MSSGWQRVALGDIAVDGPTNGYSPPSSPTASGTRSLKLSATTQGRLILDEDTVKHLHETISPDSWAWLAPGDLLVQRSNTAELVGTAAIFDGPPNSYIYPDLMMRLRFADEATTKWVWRYLNSPLGRRFLRSVAAGAAGSMPKISGAKLRAMPIPLPSLSEQRRITDMLDKADAIRQKRNEAIALTDDLLRSTFLEIFGDPVTNPKGWPVLPLGDLAEAASGVTKGKRYEKQRMVTLPYMRVANVQDGHLALDEVKFIDVSEEDGRRYQLRPGDVLLTEGGDPDKLGRGTVWRGEIAECIHQNHIFRVRPGPQMRSEYLSAIIGSDRGKNYFLRAAKQTTGIATINMTQLKAFPVLLPPVELQIEYSAFIDRATAARRTFQQRGDLVDTLFASLVDRAFSGSLDAAC
ncbi:MAG: restriction endonuclease subunit S [Kofleriaceae bacterium]